MRGLKQLGRQDDIQGDDQRAENGAEDRFTLAEAIEVFLLSRDSTLNTGKLDKGRDLFEALNAGGWPGTGFSGRDRPSSRRPVPYRSNRSSIGEAARRPLFSFRGRLPQRPVHP